jgi:putative hydrolase
MLSTDDRSPAESTLAPRGAHGTELAVRRTNLTIADRLREAASLLEDQGANPFRVQAYRHTAAAVAASREDITAIARRAGLSGLVAVPGIGPRTAQAIQQLARYGHWSELDRLRGAADPEKVFCRVPGVGPVLARLVHDRLDIGSLEGLEAAAHDGRLAKVPGFGERRAAMVRAALAAMLGRVRPADVPVPEPPVEQLLRIDEEYREGAAAGRLRRVAPRRFNPTGETWLPILHTEHEPWHYTALFSNTGRAHALGRTRDWVVIYFHDDGGPEAQRTVVTETRGPLRGRRVVRGRETECQQYYERVAGGGSPPQPAEPHPVSGRA